MADAALEGHLDARRLRSFDAVDAIRLAQEIKGLGPFGAELTVHRGANHPDAIPHNEPRLEAEILEPYGPDRNLADVSEKWRPYRTWAAAHLRTLREQRAHQISGSTHR